jgi:hypothetical protein
MGVFDDETSGEFFLCIRTMYETILAPLCWQYLYIQNKLISFGLSKLQFGKLGSAY